ncbi:Electron transfer flavoprotein subunit alpha [Desulfitobacterium hafniense]|uniref:Electron transfer flavoprotein subunit alpha n=1 Tax=Desulfitobacterium hafniense TaxID=49338 RepID=A0A098B508_DESHA|nr:electron transfer flavoprotein subunit alpha/FixB family protein [Desulfitobacterium hafniense]CDX03963.1 Electron transfer flavoprotein subunit alpha [Desulfitobacterium hafniense]
MENIIWTWLELNNGELSESSMEILGEARKLGNTLKGQIHAFLLGEYADEAAAKAAIYGADVIYIATDSIFRTYCPEACLAAFAQQVSRPPRIVMISGTRNGASLAPRIAARFQWGYLANVVKVAPQEDGGLKINTETFQAKVNNTYTFSARQTVVLVLQPGSIGVGKADKKRTGEVRPLEPLADMTNHIEITGFIKADPRSVSLNDAERVVAGGNGFCNQEDLKILQGFADALGAAVGSSKPIADKGWVTYNRLVGQSSGRRLAPNLFVSVGISGATHFIEGMKESPLIISINKDKGAPLMKEADLAVVGDLYEILPEITRQIKAMRGEAEDHGK